MNEFACVLDAEGVRSSAQKRKRYLTSERQNWMMPLCSAEERPVLLALYDDFREELKSMNAISVDQLIADFIGFLDSNRWDVLRAGKGFDAIFVDELHLFNREERMVFQSLMSLLQNPNFVRFRSAPSALEE